MQVSVAMSSSRARVIAVHSCILAKIEKSFSQSSLFYDDFLREDPLDIIEFFIPGGMYYLDCRRIPYDIMYNLLYC